MLKDSLDENLKMKSEYESKLVEVQDKLDVSKVENTDLQEKVEVLFKLGREYIDKNENTSLSKTGNETSVLTVGETKKQTCREDEIETVTIEDVTTEATNDDLQTWSRNKLRGFKRTGPSTAAERILNSKPGINVPSQAAIGAKKSHLPKPAESPQT